MKIQALFFDLDGTLLDSTGRVLQSSIDEIRKARDAGYVIGIATGRDAESVRNLLGEWKLEGLIDVIAGTGGAEILDLNHDLYEHRHMLEGKLIEEVIEHFEDMDCNFAIPWNGVIYAPKDDRHIRELSKADLVPYEVVDFKGFLKTPKPKVMIVCDPQLMPAVIERSKTFSSEKFKSASLQTASVLYEYMDPQVSKPDGIEAALKPYNLTLDDVAAFGDADNDTSMLQKARLGIAMGNASEGSKAVADLITDDNDHDGIAHAIDFFLDYCSGQ